MASDKISGSGSTAQPQKPGAALAVVCGDKKRPEASAGSLAQGSTLGFQAERRRMDPPLAYHVTQWNDVHENHESRKLVYLRYVCFPTNLSALRYRRITSHERRYELLCCWHQIVVVAALSSPPWRGWLVRGELPLNAQDLAHITGLDTKCMDFTLKFLSSAEIGWLELIHFPGGTGESPALPGESPGVSGDSPGNPPKPSGRMGWDGMGSEGSTEGGKNKGERLGDINGAVVAASRTQWVAIRAEIGELEARPRSELTPEERTRLRELKSALVEIRRKQQKGHFK